MKRWKKVLIIIIPILLFGLAFRLIGLNRNNSFLFKYEWRNLKIENEDHALYWFFVTHSNNSNDIMFTCMEKDMGHFAPDLVLVEGGANTFEGTREEALAHSGENDYATVLAKERGIPVEDIEPSIEQQVAYLESKYSPDAIMAMYLLRAIGAKEAMPLNNVSQSMEDFLIKNTKKFCKRGVHYQYNSVDDILNTLNTYIPEEMNANNWMSLNLIDFYQKSDNEIHSIYMDTYHYRNSYLLELIKEKKEEYPRIFVVMGGQHLIDTKEDLKEMYR